MAPTATRKQQVQKHRKIRKKANQSGHRSSETINGRTLPVGKAQYCTKWRHLMVSYSPPNSRGTNGSTDVRVLRHKGRTDGSNERLLPIILARERTAPGLCPLACASGRSGRFQRAPAAPPRRTTAGAAAPAPAPSSPASTRPDARAAGGGGAAAAAVLITGILSHGDP